jgi:predicted nicotinamide N-methyase
MATCDEADFIEIIVANERIQGWLDVLKSSKDTMRIKECLSQLATSVSNSEAYAEEATSMNVIATLTSLLKTQHSDEILLDSISNAIAACSGPMACKGRLQSYIFPSNNNIISVTIQEGALGQGVGAKVWSAALVLCQELADHPSQLVQGKQVLELGSGCGVCGIVAAHLGAERVVLTDYGDDVLQLLRQCMHLNSCEKKEREKEDTDIGNIVNNMEDWDPEDASTCSDEAELFGERGGGAEQRNSDDDDGGGGGGGGTVSTQKQQQQPWEIDNMEVRFLDWNQALHNGDSSNGGGLDGVATGTIAPALLSLSLFDIIIGSEVIYERSMADSLPATIFNLLKPGGMVLLCCAVRDQGIFDVTLENCRKGGLRVGSVQVTMGGGGDGGRGGSRGGLGRGESEYEGGVLMIGMDWEGCPCGGWHRDDLFV